MIVLLVLVTVAMPWSCSCSTGLVLGFSKLNFWLTTSSEHEAIGITSTITPKGDRELYGIKWKWSHEVDNPWFVHLVILLDQKQNYSWPTWREVRGAFCNSSIKLVRIGPTRSSRFRSHKVRVLVGPADSWLLGLAPSRFGEAWIWSSMPASVLAPARVSSLPIQLWPPKTDRVSR